jgi:hypothetical protein
VLDAGLITLHHKNKKSKENRRYDLGNLGVSRKQATIISIYSEYRR